MARRENLTIRQVATRVAGARAKAVVRGSPQTIADYMEEWFRNDGCDGFNIMPPFLPGGLDDFVELVIPELQRRGLFRTEYEGKTLRENLGLRRPVSRYAKPAGECARAAGGVRRITVISVKRLGHATLTSPDIERQIAYYTDVIGLTLVERGKDRAYLASRLGLEAVALEPGGINALSALSLQVAPGTDLKDVERGLTQDGVKCQRANGISPGVAEAVVFTDPKGTRIEIFSDYAFAKDDGGTAGIAPLKLGHVAYRVDNVQKIVKFYCDVLGFRVSDWRADDFAFLRCNSDHHTVNFVYDAEPQLHHIAFEVKDWAEIQRAAETLARHDIHLVWGPGRHIIGHNIAIYHRNADKVRVEFFCEMDLMKDESLGYFDPRPWHQDRPQYPKSVGTGYAAELLGLRLGARHSRLSDGRVDTIS